MEIYSVLEKKEILMDAVTRMIFEDIILSKIARYKRKNITWFYLAGT